MQHITYVGRTIRLRGKLAASRGNLIPVPYPPNTMRVTEWVPTAHFAIKFLTHLKDNQSASNRPTGDYLKDQTVTKKKITSITVRQPIAKSNKMQDVQIQPISIPSCVLSMNTSQTKAPQHKIVEFLEIRRRVWTSEGQITACLLAVHNIVSYVWGPVSRRVWILLTDWTI